MEGIGKKVIWVVIGIIILLLALVMGFLWYTNLLSYLLPFLPQIGGNKVNKRIK